MTLGSTAKRDHLVLTGMSYRKIANARLQSVGKPKYQIGNDIKE